MLSSIRNVEDFNYKYQDAGISTELLSYMHYQSCIKSSFCFPKKRRKLFNRIWEITDKYRLCFLQWLIYHLKYERSENWSFLVAWLIINLVYVLPKMGSLPKYIALTKHWCKESVSTFRYFPMLTDVRTHVKDINV